MREQNTKYKKPNTNNGITLIALIITIIVMLILVAVTISMAVNGGLFDYAGKATGETQNAIDKEQDLGSGKVTVDNKVYDSIDDYLAGKEATLSYEETEKDETTKVLKANAAYTSGEYTAVIPKGFKIIPGINNTTTIEDGLVIQDAEGNEFVWIPVKYTKTNVDENNNGYDDGFDNVFYRSNWEEDAANGGKRGTTRYTETSEYREPFANGYTNETEEYNNMVKSVYENSGFYIGRYEAGSITARTDVANRTTEMVVKRDAYPYNYVGWGLTMSDYSSNVISNNKDQGKGALLLSKELYGTEEDKGKYGVTSTLCYGIMWDAMLDYIKDANHDVTKSTSWGNYKDNAWTITRKKAKYTTSPASDTTWSLIDDEEEDIKVKTSSESILLTTGASDKFAAKNIFDIAGNVDERTNEAYSSDGRTRRGGSFGGFDGSVTPAAFRGTKRSVVSEPDVCGGGLGFRIALYIL